MNQDITPPTNNQQPDSPQGFGAPSTPETPEQQTGQVIPLQTGPKKHKLKTFLIVLLFLILLGAVAGAYFYQQGKIDDVTSAKTAVDQKAASLQAQLGTTEAKAAAAAKKVTTPAVNYDVVTGAVTTQATGSATLNSLYKSGTVDEVWVEYGTAPDALTLSSKHVVSKDLPAAAAGAYGQQGFTVTGLKSSQDYFYRVAAKNKTTTVYGGVVSFTSVK